MGGKYSTDWERRNVYSILVGKLEAQRPLGRPWRTWEDNIRIDIREIGWEAVKWILLPQYMDQWRDLVNEPWVFIKDGKFLD
jgi:hypothetical protein